MQQMADYFNKYAELTTTTFYESDFSTPAFKKGEYLEFLKQSTDYKVELMEMVIKSLRESAQQQQQ
jgi:hypothetical protein